MSLPATPVAVLTQRYWPCVSGLSGLCLHLGHFQDLFEAWLSSDLSSGGLNLLAGSAGCVLSRYTSPPEPSVSGMPLWASLCPFRIENSALLSLPDPAPGLTLPCTCIPHHPSLLPGLRPICPGSRLHGLVCGDCTSSMTTQICFTHWMMASGVPEMVTARSVELGSMSPATWT